MVDIRSSVEQLGLNATGFADYVDNVEVEVNSSELFAEVWESLPTEILQKISLMLDIGKWVLIAILSYIIIKIIFQFMKVRDSANIAAIAINTKTINAKLDALIHKKNEREK